MHGDYGKIMEKGKDKMGKSQKYPQSYCPLFF